MRVSTCVVFVLLTSVQLLSAHAGNGQDMTEKEIALELKDVSLSEALSKVEALSGFRLAWSSQAVARYDHVSLEKGVRTVEQTLSLLLENTALSFREQRNTILIFRKAGHVKEAAAAMEQLPDTRTDTLRRRISGKVVAAGDGSPLIGVTVIISGTKYATITDGNGEYSLEVGPEAKSLEFRYVGFLTKTLDISASSVINVSLAQSDQSLNEVVVVAYGTAKRESLTGAVSAISDKDIQKRPLSSVVGALEGAAPGIQVSNTYGEPGANPTIRIRGFTSVNGSNAPLYVLDGVQFGGNISDLNPADIESISVLKDAASAALYGNRASNGVIIITTKRGRRNRMSMNVSVNQGLYTRGIREYDRLGPDDWMETMWTGYRNYLMTSQPDNYPSRELANAEASRSLVSDYVIYNLYNKPGDALFDANGKLVADAQIRDSYKGDLDWYDPIERVGHRQDYFINGGSRSEKSGFYFSGGYLDEKGYVKRSDFKRFTGRLNADMSPVKWLKAGIQLAGSHQASNNTTGSTDNAASFVNPFMYARQIAPVYPVHLHDMATGEYVLDANGNKQYDDGTLYSRPQYSGRHVIWENGLDMDRTYRNTINGQAFMDISFLKDFKFTLRGDLNVRNSENQTYNNAIIGDGAGNKGRAERNIYRYKNYTFQQQLNWTRSFHAHTIDVLVGHENYSYNENYLNGYKTLETFAGMPELVNFTEITRLSDYQHNYKTESYLSRVRYSYDEKYFADASFRTDGSSRFYRDNRWGNFWSVGGSWLISRENFMQPIAHAVNDLKLRASYGEVGNDQSVDYYAYMALYTLGQNANMGALYKIQNDAKDLIWETAASFGVALEGRLFDRVNFGVEYFDKRSKDLLFDVNMPLSSGGTSVSEAESTIAKNIGSVSNKGIEVMVDVDVLKRKNLTWNIGVNATVLKNKILKLPEENRENGIISGTKRYLEGHGVYDFWLHQYVGVDQMTGNALYLPDTETYDLNGSAPGKDPIPEQYLVQIGKDYYTTYTTYAKRDWSGSALPDVYGAISSTLTWKNLSLSTVLTYSLGGKVLDYSYQSLMSMSGNPSALHKDLLKAWKDVPAGMTEGAANRIDPDGVPVVDFARSQFTNATSSRFLQDASYFVIKNIALGYKVPQTWIDRLGLNSATINLAVENLATFTSLRGMNPQQSFNGLNNNAFVTARVFSAGVNIGL